MTTSGENEGFRMVDDFVCDAIPASGIPQADLTMPQRLSDFHLADLVPETQEWNNGRGIALESWIGCVGSIEHAIGYGRLLWPEFTEFDDCVFFAGFSEESYHGFMRQAGGNKQAVEGVMNHRHILDLFSPPERQPTREQLVYLGRLLKEMWTAKLHRDFPTRRIVTSFFEEPGGDLVDYIITFFQEVHST